MDADELIQKLISALTGSPGISNLLSMFTNMAVGGQFQNQANFFEAASMNIGASGVFGARDPAGQMLSTMHQNQMAASMKGVSDVVDDARREFAAAAHRRFFPGTSEADIERYSRDDLNITTALSNRMFNFQNQTDALQAGMQSGLRRMGSGFNAFLVAGDEDLYNSITREQTRVNRMAEFVAGDFVNNRGQFGGLAGRDVGMVFDELARTGRLGDLPVGDTRADSPELINLVRETSKTVSELGNLVKGNAIQRMGTLDAISGMNFAASFGVEGSKDMVFDAVATQSVSGFSPDQFMALAAASAQTSRHFGADSFGALSQARDLSGLLSVHRQLPPSRFVNEQRLRETMIQRVAGAHEGRTAKMISGAAALIQMEGGDVEAFEQAINESEGRLTADQILEMSGLEGITSGDLMAASVMDEAKEFRHRGRATMRALRSNMDTLEENRRHVANQIAGEELTIRGPVTKENVKRAIMAAENIENPHRVIAQVEAAFERQAKAVNMESGSAVDDAIRMTHDDTRLAEIRKKSEAVAGMRKFVSDSDLMTSGIDDLMEYIKNDPEAGVNMGKLLSAVTGRKNVDATEMLGKAKGLIDTAVKDNEVAKFGAASLMRDALTGRVKLSQKQIAALDDDDVSKEDRVKVFESYARTQKADELLTERVNKMVAEDALQVDKDKKAGKDTREVMSRDEAIERVNKMVAEDALQVDKDKKAGKDTREVMSRDEAIDRVILEDFQALEDKTLSKADRQELEKILGEDDIIDDSERRKFREIMAKEAEKNNAFAIGAEGGNASGIENILTEILQLLLKSVNGDG
jgi:hypothetical protein